MRRRSEPQTQEKTVPLPAGTSRPPRSQAMQLLALQRHAGNRAVVGALKTPGRRLPKLAGTPIALQRAAYEYGARERATATTGRGILGTDVTLLAGTGSGYNAASNSVVVADFEPGSAVVRDSTMRELRGSWINILERSSSQPYEVLGFTDRVGDERANQKLRADRARAVAALFPKTARRASVIGAAPAADFLSPANSTPSERALNRSVLLRLPFAELSQPAEVDEYSADAVAFWRSNPNSSVSDLINFVTRQGAGLLERNGVHQPKVIKDKAVRPGSSAHFEAKNWQITIDEATMASASSQRGVTPKTKMSALTIDAVADLASDCYHEFRHAEQTFMAARLTAEEAKGDMSPRDLAMEVGIPVEVADDAISASSTVLPDKLKVEARAWRTTGHGGRYVEYKKWNDGLRAALEIFVNGVEWDALKKMDSGSIREVWEKGLSPFIDQTLRRDYSLRADTLLRDMKADPRHDPLDDEIRRALTETSSKLFVTLAKERGGKNLPGRDAIAKMDPVEANLAHRTAQSWVLKLQLAVTETRQAADTAYRAYPEEAEAYRVGEAVKVSVKRQGP